MALRQASVNVLKTRDVIFTLRQFSSSRSVCLAYEQRKTIPLLPWHRSSDPFAPFSTVTTCSKSNDASSDSSRERKTFSERKSGRSSGSSASSGGNGSDGGDKDLLKCPKCGETCIHVETFVCKYVPYCFWI